MREHIRRLQNRLGNLGHPPGPADGILGPLTIGAMNSALDAYDELKHEQRSVGIIPREWMPAANMRRTVLHWTAGTYKPNDTDLRAYHLLIDDDVQIVLGVHPISANEPPIKGPYAQHVGGANSGSIGVALCGMHGAVEQPFDPGRFPIKRTQWDMGVEVIVQLCRRYAIPVREDTVLTHAEVRPTLGVGAARWDITHLPWDSSVRGHKPVGDKLREEVRALL